MTPEETQFVAKPVENDPESRFAGVSIRAWLALVVIGGVTLIEVGRATAILARGGEYAVNGEFLMLASGIMAHYFSDKNKTQSKP